MSRVIFIPMLFLIICLIACTQKPNDKKQVNNISSKDSLVEALVKEKQWLNFHKLDEIGSDTILYKRNEQNDNIIGLLNWKNKQRLEMHISNDYVRFFPQSMWFHRGFLNNRIMVFNAKGKNNESLVTFYHCSDNDSVSYITFQGEVMRNYGTNNKVWIKGIKTKLDNISMELIVYIDESGINIHELNGLKGEFYGSGGDVVNLEGRKKLVQKIRMQIVDKIIDDGVQSYFRNIPNVEDYVNEGKHNPMRFNDKYRNNSIDISGIIKDIDEPWGSRYKYRVKLEGCHILTDNRSVLDLNKGDYVYMRGICSNFDSNSYQLTMIDGFVLTNEHAEDFVRTMMNRTEEVLDERLRSIGDYNIYYEDALVIN